MSFSTAYVVDRTRKAKFFRDIDKIIDWKKIGREIGKYYSKGESVTGRPSYDGLVLFKMLLVGIWYGLSDESVEEMTLDSLSVMQFCGLKLEDPVPDHCTLSRFRSELTKQKAWDKLLNKFNGMLKTKKVMLRKGTAKVDASLTASNYKPPKPNQFKITEDRKEDNRELSEVKKESDYQLGLEKINTSIDQEARWVKKAGKYTYGYKRTVATDSDGMIEAVHTTAANEHDSKGFKPVLEKVSKKKKKAVYADKAYKSKDHDEYLKKQGIKNRVHYKAYKNRSLTKWEKVFNRGVSKKRWVVERTFGSIKKWFDGGTARYKGLAKTHGQHVLEAIAHNLKRSPGLVWERALS